MAGALATIGLMAGSGYVVARASLRPGLGAIAGLLAAVEVVAFVRAPLRYGERLVAHDAAFRALTRWRVWLFDRLEPLSPSGLQAWRSGDLLTRAIDDVDTLQDLYVRAMAPVLVATAASTVAVVVVAVLLPLAGLVLGCLLIAGLALPAALSLANGSSEEEEWSLRGELASDVVDLVQGAPELLAYGRTEEHIRGIEDLDRRLNEMAGRRARRGAVASSLIVLCTGMAAIGVLALSVDAVHSHRVGVTMAAVLPLAAIAAFESVPQVSLAAHRMGSLVAAGKRLLALDEHPVPVVDPANPVPVPEGVPPIELADARLRYDDDLPWALDGLALSLGTGAHVVLTGPSGSGKTSVVNVLLRFWNLSGGSATLGDVPLGQLAQDDVRRSIALVDQDARLFGGTLRHNVTLARPRASDGEIAEVLEAAQLSEWVGSLPQQLDTPIGEAGRTVSGGQRQRIALARALLAGSPVLVLDEPTTGLDEDTAGRLLQDVLAAAKGRSILLVTHHEEEIAGFSTHVAIVDGRAVSTSSPERGDFVETDEERNAVLPADAGDRSG